MRRMRVKLVLMLLCSAAAGLHAGVIVPGLNDSSALKNYTAAYQGGTDEINPDITNGQMTLAARFNPDASQQTGGPFIILEIGGTSNGTGLYLCGGHVVFVCRTGSNFTLLPESLQDTNFAVINNARTIAVELGSVMFGSENVVYASLDLIAGQLTCSVNGVLNTYTITNTANTNFDGNESICFLTKGTAVNGWMGGLHEQADSAMPLLYAANSAGLTQTAGYNNQRGQIFNGVANLAVLPRNPVPANGAANVDPAAVTQLQFSTAGDPANTSNPNPAVTGHFVTVYQVENGEPNLILPPLMETFAGAGVDPIAVDYTFELDDLVCWQVEEQIAGRSKGDPNNIVGPVWSFKALSSVPVVTASPADSLVFGGEQTVFVCEFASKSQILAAQWYRNADPNNPISDADADIAISLDQNGSSYTCTLAIANVEPADQDTYWFHVQNVAGQATSQSARLIVKRQVAHWTLDETDLVGGQYLDTSGEGHHATPNTVPGSSSFIGGVDPAKTGDGLDLTVLSGTAADSGDWTPSLNTGQVTVSAWLKWTGSNGGWQGVISNRSAVGAATANFYIEIRQDNGRLQIGGIEGAGDVQVDPLATGEWAHMAITARAGEVVIYINGEPLNTNTAALAVRQNIVPLRIGALGRDATSGDLLSPFNGAMDDVQIFNYALSSDKVVDLYYAVREIPVCLNLQSLDLRFDMAGGGALGDEPDCKVSIADFAVFAGTWLNCGLYPVCP